MNWSMNLVGVLFRIWELKPFAELIVRNVDLELAYIILHSCNQYDVMISENTFFKNLDTGKAKCDI